MPKSKRMSVERRPRLSQDALFFLHKVFVPDTDKRIRTTCVDLKGRVLGPRALEASCELIETGFIHVEEREAIYRLLKPFPDPPLKLQRVREAYEAFDLFVRPMSDETIAKEIQDIAAFNPIIETMAALSRVQTDLLCALRYPCLSDSVARLHVQHAMQALQRLGTEGVNSLETVLKDPD